MTAPPNLVPFPWDKAPPATPNHAECQRVPPTLKAFADKAKDIHSTVSNSLSADCTTTKPLNLMLQLLKFIVCKFINESFTLVMLWEGLVNYKPFQ